MVTNLVMGNAMGIRSFCRKAELGSKLGSQGDLKAPVRGK